jgi:pimeloyl-ACP methyl ester carboxylesterase
MNMEEIININGKNLFVKTMGNGAPLFFLHSSLLTSEMWNTQIEYFSKKYLTITYDFCGHGKSELPKGSYSDYEDLKTIIDKKNLSKIILIGCSYGGSVALDFTLKYPEYVSKLILISPTINGYNYPLRLTLESIRNFRNVQKYGIERAAELFMNNKYWSYFVPKENDFKEIFKKLYIGNGIFYNGKYSQKYILKPFAIKRLSEINTDVLLIIGKNDSNFNKNVSKILMDRIGKVKYYEINGCGHLPNIEKNEEVNKIIGEFNELQ